MRYSLRHRTQYKYSVAVDVAHHLAHLHPRPSPGQSVEIATIAVEPRPATFAEHVDHYGNRACLFAIDHPHQQLTVEAHSIVEVAKAPLLDVEGSPAWESIRDSLTADGFPLPVEATEFIHPSPLVPKEAAAFAYGAELFMPGRPVAALALALTQAINRDFAYEAGVTDTSTKLATVFEQRAGVCQDLAHAQIAVWRAHGMAARYVSGYIRTYAPQDSAHLRGADASHAWVALWCGPELGWLQFDPTNNCLVGEDHVVVAWGRDFADVSPVRGVILGGGAHVLTVEVELKPLDRST